MASHLESFTNLLINISACEKKHQLYKSHALNPKQIEQLTSDWTHFKEFKQTFSMIYLVMVASFALEKHPSKVNAILEMLIYLFCKIACPAVFFCINGAARSLSNCVRQTEWKTGRVFSRMLRDSTPHFVGPSVCPSIGWSVHLLVRPSITLYFFCLWPHCSCPNDQVTSNTAPAPAPAPAHPHATGVAVCLALFNL